MKDCYIEASRIRKVDFPKKNESEKGVVFQQGCVNKKVL